MADSTPGTPVIYGDDADHFARVPDALIFATNLTPMAVRVWAALDRYAGIGGECWPGMNGLARRLEVHRATLRRAMTELEEAGWLTIVERFDEDGGQRSNLYVIYRTPRARAGARRVATETAGEVASGSAAGSRPDARQNENQENENQENEKPLAPSTLDAGSVAVERRARPPDLLWEAVLEACGITGTPTPSARGAYNRAVADLRAVEATPEEVIGRAAMFRARWPGASLTPTALARRWAECEPDARNLPRTATRAPSEFARAMALEAARYPMEELE